MSEPTCPTCGAVATKGPNQEWTPWFSCDSVGEQPCFRQSDKCRIRELEQKCERLAKDKERLQTAIASLHGIAESMHGHWKDCQTTDTPHDLLAMHDLLRRADKIEQVNKARPS